MNKKDKISTYEKILLYGNLATAISNLILFFIYTNIYSLFISICGFSLCYLLYTTLEEKT
jgi:hypothetical protein